MTEELKPCPFCGADDPKMMSEPGMGGMAERPGYFWIACVRCGGASIRYDDYFVNPKAQVITAWNRRAPVVTEGFAEIEIGLGPVEKVKLTVRGTPAEIRAAAQKINRWNRKHRS